MNKQLLQVLCKRMDWNISPFTAPIKATFASHVATTPNTMFRVAGYSGGMVVVKEISVNPIETGEVVLRTMGLAFAHMVTITEKRRLAMMD